MDQELGPILFIVVLLALTLGVMWLVETRRKPTIMQGWLDKQGSERLFTYWDAPSAAIYAEGEPRHYRRLLEAWQGLTPLEAWFQHNLSRIGVTPVGATVGSAKRWCLRAWQKQQDPAAAYYLGMMQLMGLGGKPEYRSALELLTAAEQGGIANAITARGLMLLREPANGEDWPIDLPEQQRFAEAVACFRQGLEHGDRLAALNLGYCLEHGIGIAADAEAAIDSYLMAARQGEPAAQYRLSMLFAARGDLAEAYVWARVASQCSESDIAVARSRNIEAMLEPSQRHPARQKAALFTLEIVAPRMQALAKNMDLLKVA
ncbi:tetratricopeptide repeat protein [Shewanella algae]|uniref:tetratricopeptide repeat protein n=1 Tax=Shewanella algae TaxID=38313 RepID=UPI001AAE0FEC|nr:tetratricopeptide repeat protein [Shewanella algae]MBO2689459.1 sel1 repeat family protein [Shewanella algae]